MVRRSYKKSRTSRRSRKQGGGGLGNGYTFGAPIVAGLGQSAEVIPTSSCMATADRFGMISSPMGSQGLPGFKGGARSRKQRGGRYTFDLSDTVGRGPMGGISSAVRIPCSTQAGGVGGVDSAVYQAPTAGYSPAASTWVSSGGTPSLLAVPYEARAMNPACLKTAGGARRRSSRRSRTSKKRAYRK